MMKKSLAIILASAFAAVTFASRISETISLEKGWNAIYLEASPDVSAPAEFFADMPGVLRVGSYESSVYDYTEQITSDGSEIGQKPVSFFVWERGKDASSTLQRLMGGRAYLIYATNACEKTFTGVPGQPHTSWQVSDGGFTTLAGVSIPRGMTVSSQTYFREGPPGAACSLRPISLFGDEVEQPDYLSMNILSRKPQLNGGMAYAFESPEAGNWPGVISLSAGLTGGLLRFAGDATVASFSLANTGTANRQIRLSWNAGADTTEAKPSMRLKLPRNGAAAAVWTNFTEHVFDFAPGEKRTYLLRVDRSTAAGAAKVGGVIAAEDLSGTKMRVRMGVTVEPETDDSSVGAFPKGLWFGNVTLMQVDEQSSGTPVEAGGKMKLNMMLHVDGDGNAALLQRIAVATSATADDKGAYDTRLFTETANVPSGYTARRISTVFPDVAHRSVAASADCAFGTRLSYNWTVAADARDNPFRHAWHPDHGTGFAVTNRLSLTWADEWGNSTYSTEDPDEVTYGIAVWRLGGLSGKGDITMRGVFALKRIIPVPEIEQ